MRRPSASVRVVCSAVYCDDFALAQAGRRVSRELRLYADDMALRTLLADRRCHTAQQSTAANRGKHEVNFGAIVEDLQPAGALTGDDRRIVIGRDDGVAVLGCQGFGTFTPLRAGGSDVDNLGAERRYRLALDRRRIRGHDDDGAERRRRAPRRPRPGHDCRWSR